MTTEEKLIDYFARRRVVLSMAAANYIVRLVLDDADPEGSYEVVKYRHTFMKTMHKEGMFEKIRTVRVPVKKVMEVLVQEIPEVFNEYKFVVIDREGNKLKEIFTARANLFNL